VRKHFARYGEWWWVPILYALACGGCIETCGTKHGFPTGFGWDAIDSYGPDLQYQSDDLASGHFSLWNPYDKGGYALVGDPQYAATIHSTGRSSRGARCSARRGG